MSPTSDRSVQMRLCIAGSTPNSVRAKQNLGDVLAALGIGRDAIAPDIIDVFTNGKRAVIDGVIVAPTLVVLQGGKRYTIVGDLSDVSQLRAILG